MTNGSSCFLLLASYFACKKKGHSVAQAMYAYSKASQPIGLVSEDEMSNMR